MVVGGRTLVGRGEPVLPGLTDALRTLGMIVRRMQERG
jgi:8-oxoguanine deaminase